MFIEPDSPWENGFVESFHGKLRDECLSEEIFWSRGEAHVVMDWYREIYNRERPHSSLGYATILAVVPLILSGRVKAFCRRRRAR